MNSQTTTETQKFTSDVVWVAISRVLISLTGIIILSTLTKSFTSDTYGIWIQVNVTVGLLTPILTLHLGTAVVRFLAGEEEREKRRQAFSAMLWSVLAFSCLALLISVLLRQSLSIFLFASPQYATFIPLTFLWSLVETLFQFSLSYLRARGKIKRLSIVRIALSAMRVILIVVLAIAGYSLGWIIACLIAIEALFMVAVFGVIIREIGFPKPALGGLKGYLAFSVPQIPSGMLIWIISASDRYFITHFLNLSQVGIYSASYSLGNLISFFYMPIGFVLLPTVSKFWEGGKPLMVKNYFKYSTRVFLFLAIPAAAGLYILSQPLLSILTTSEYMVGGSLVLLVSLGAVLFGIYNLNVYIIYLVQQTKWLPLMVAVAAVINVGINVVLIPQIGIIGAAISTIVSFFVLAVIVTVRARRAISYKIEFKFLSKVVAATLVMAFCLKFIEINSVLGIVLAIIAGAAIFGLGIFLSRAFSREDRRLIREALTGLNPRL